jgi:hypothetical protein
MEHYLKSAIATIVVIAIVWRVDVLRTTITGQS